MPNTKIEFTAQELEAIFLFIFNMCEFNRDGCMKKILLCSAFAAAFSMFVACGDDSGSNSKVSEDDSGNGAKSYESEEDMPNCTATHAGELAVVEGEYFLCVPKKWRPLEGSVDSECGLPACGDDLEGAYFYANSAETYFQCVEGEWLGADGEPLGAEIADKCLRDSLAETAVESEDDLPNCTAKRKDVMFLVGDVIMLCNGEDWVPVDEVKSSSSKAKSSASAPKSSDSEVESSDDDDPDAKSSSSKAKSSSSAAPKSSSSTSKSSSSAAKPTVDEDAMTMKDNRTGRTYNLKNIGGILWTTTNLITGTKSGDGVYCAQNGDGDNVCTKYGSFYDYETAQTACPSGWRLPTLEETEAAWSEPTDESWQWVLAGRFKIGGDNVEYGKEGEEGRIWIADIGDNGAFQFGGGWMDQLNEPDRGHNVRCVTESTAASSSSAAASSSSVSQNGPVEGVCEAPSTPIEKGESVEWTFTRISGAKVETYSWTFSNGVISTEASPIVTYENAGEFTATVVINEGMDSESTTECSGSLEVMGIAISGCTCEFSDEGGALRDLADGSPVTVAWAVSGCENADGSMEFKYQWSEGVKNTPKGVSAEFTERTKNFTPSVTVTNADGMSMTAICPTVNIDDSDNPEYELTEQITEISLPAGTTVITMNLPEGWHNETSGDAHFQCVPKVTATTLTVDGESVGPGWYLSLLIPITSTINGYKLEVTLDNPADCQVRW